MVRNLIVTAAILLSFGALSAADKPGSATAVTGVITDSICARAGSHQEAMQMSKDMGKTAASCTRACVRQMGAKYVLYDGKSKKTYKLSDQARASEFAGQAVRVTGVLNKNEIEVQSIAAQ